MKYWIALIALALAGPAAAQDRILFTNVNVWDGAGAALAEGTDVLVEGNLIEAVGVGLSAPDATVIDGGGRTLMPGLTDAHVHLMMQDITGLSIVARDMTYVGLVAARAAEEMLMRGFTTVRDLGGPVHGLKAAIDEGLVPGPRIYPSGAMITQTSGHFDFRLPFDIPAEADALTPFERRGFMFIADGVPMVRKRTREALMQGSTQIKVAAGGGVSSNFDPLDVRQYSLEEMAAIVDTAEAWNTYVAVHAYTDKAVQMAIAAGVRVIEHGQLISEETAQMMVENDVWWSLQPFLDDADATPFPPESANRVKQLMVAAGTERAFGLAREFGIKTGFGTDTLNSREVAGRQGAQLAKLGRWYEPWEALKMATHDNQQLFKLSGERDPYPAPNGVIRAGAYADILLVDGNPLEDLDLVGDAAAHFDLIMKDGRIYKNTLDE
jgi:imidazolonepropionase-like amidohydrolase